MDSSILTSEDVIYLLKQKFGDTSKMKLIDYNIKPLSDKIEGFMGIHLRLKCEIKFPDHQFVYFFIKKQVENQEGNDLDETFNTTEAYNREALFYEILDENYKKFNVDWAPRHYKFVKDKTLLILDDISVDGFMLGKKSLHSSSGFDLDHCKVGLKALARLHTFSVHLENEKGKKTPNYKFTNDMPLLTEEMLISLSHKFGEAYTLTSIRCLKLAFEYLPNTTSEEKNNLKDLFQKEMDESIYDLFKPSTKFKNVFCHGDLWHKNIMFKYSGETPINCNFVDFQVFRYLPGSHDALFFIYLNTSPEFRKQNLHQLMEYYYEEFYTGLKNIGLNPCEIFSLSDFYESSANFFLLSKIMAAFYLQLLFLGDEFIEEQCKKDPAADLRIDMLFGNREKYLLPAYEENCRPYLDKFMPLVDEVKDALLNRKIMRDDCFDIVRRKISSDDYLLKNYEVLPNRSKNLLKITILSNDTITSLNFFMKCLNDDLNRKEVFIYQLLSLNDLLINMEVINQVMPKCYYSVNARSIVLENLEEAGFKHVDTLDYQLVDTVIKTLAKFHSVYLVLEHKSQTEKVHKFYEFSDIIAELEKENTCSTSKENLINLLKPSKTFKNILCHGNLSLKNIMFKDGRECRFVDFKQSRLLPPSYDILTFLYMSTSRSFRDQNLNQIIDSYYDYLTIELGRSNIIVTEILTFIDFKNSFDEIKSILEQNPSLKNLSIN